ncbi:polyphosphate kinase [Alcanivorax jadensis T9]|jgi:polyphosphate kinase|uniref:Polyphosphate kinase n=1 Tax=Alcanivorax jadensis T9 TaxID=1177181 RepID=A0ABR4WBC1_9GAMM|nr:MULTISPECIES: polyphosphate kinase 1 [Alcanivorax]KGD60689.1 polyphosphate kinase [Alcanivorax jadensis T9]MAC13900.1 polyphosphate kinase 1 [Alcanivorax sp.]MBP22432.1 polyphosphate kinase 1 [Alcanivorax sp.]|tara:strand:+ start:589 stop:2676 length:2088 start_codon:yes stop_codon:yes gene_type:complete
MNDIASEHSAIDLNNPDYYFNRELSLLQFNLRVLEQAMDDSHPLMERLNFLLIFSSNMDEFFEIRVAGLKNKLETHTGQPGPDGMLAEEVLKEISRITHDAVDRQYHILNNILLPALREEGVDFLRREDWTEAQVEWVKKYFREQIYPVLTPIALDPSHPFPRLVNKSLNFIVSLDGKDAFGRSTGLAIVPAPRSLPRLIRIPDEISESGDDNFVFLSSMIHAHVSDLFPGMKATGCYQFRVTRNADMEVDEDVEDLASALKGQLLSLRYGDEVRLEVADNCPRHLIDYLLEQFELTEIDLYEVNGPVNLARMFTSVNRPRLHYSPFSPKLAPAVKKADTIFDAMDQGDILLHHPYESFQPVINLLAEAARDPKVLAIKQTLYRTGTKSEILDHLETAARNGKEVTAIVELRARFDEESNIEGARRLQEAGAIVVYGVVGYKTHAKMLLVVRREGDGIKRYVHLGTGNYHTKTTKLYTDYGLMTCEKGICQDVHKIFQELTGMGKAARLKQLKHSPFTLHPSLIEWIDFETQQATAGKPARIIAKFNSLTEEKIIQALYRASQAGVEIDLIVRGICCLKPGVPGLSENIRVRSVIGRFLEHTRIYHFHHGGEDLVYCSSADWMDRNLFNRVETCFPINDPVLKAQVIEQGLHFYLRDNSRAWLLQADGNYLHALPQDGQESFIAQHVLLETLGGS